jgi:hypothetical protein
MPETLLPCGTKKAGPTSVAQYNILTGSDFPRQVTSRSGDQLNQFM